MLYAERAPFAGQVALIATMHGKEAALGPPLRRIGFTLRTADALDTDAFGAFSGEIERRGTMLDAAREKARAAFARSDGADWVFASEGAFGPHSAVPMLSGYTELVLAWRPRDDLEIVETRRGFETNFAHADIPGADLDDVLARTGFPGHALIVKDADGAVLAKGLADRTALDALIAARGRVRVETDMRAHMNPTRMAEIGRLSETLAARLASPCPACAAPGFGRADTEIGLPCSDCGTPTLLVRREIWRCAACGHDEPRARVDGRVETGPEDCPACNP